MIDVGFLIAGVKGLGFLNGLKNLCRPAFVSSYPVKGATDDSYEATLALCSDGNIPFVNHRGISNNDYAKVDLVFIVGWQYLLNYVDDRFVVFHDSLLPRYRGFSPTVTALINGEDTIGVSAIQPSDQADCGPIYAQSEAKINYPIKLRKALQILDNCYLQVAKEVLRKFGDDNLTGVPQDEALATYSIWRDEEDYTIDWSWSAEKIARFVDAVGWPFPGAKTSYCNQDIFIDEVEVGQNLSFEDRHSGKLWSIQRGIPKVICGSGMVRILSAHDIDGKKVHFSKLRERLGVAQIPCKPSEQVAP